METQEMGADQGGRPLTPITHQESTYLRTALVKQLRKVKIILFI